VFKHSGMANIKKQQEHSNDDEVSPVNRKRNTILYETAFQLS
jgi:hypothetical protein